MSSLRAGANERLHETLAEQVDRNSKLLSMSNFRSKDQLCWSHDSLA